MEIGSKTGIFVYARRQANDALVVTIGVDEPHATSRPTWRKTAQVRPCRPTSCGDRTRDFVRT